MTYTQYQKLNDYLSFEKIIQLSREVLPTISPEYLKEFNNLVIV